MPPDRGRTQIAATTILLGTGLAVLVLVQAMGVPLSGAGGTVTACVAILLLGLPHGALDWVVLRDSATASTPRFLGLLLGYVAAGATMLCLWLISPISALILFLLISVMHFAEDWREGGSTILAVGMGTALLAMPAVAHDAAVRSIAIALAHDPDAGAVADLLRIAALIGGPLALIALWRLWRQGSRDRALAGACSLGALLLLPPVVGFALFFCLCHSPIHLRRGPIHATNLIGVAEVALPTIAAIVICAVLYAGMTGGDASSRWTSAIFLTLSVLAAAHMIVPLLTQARLQRRRADRASGPSPT